MRVSSCFLRTSLFVLIAIPVFSQSPRKAMDVLAENLQSLSTNERTVIYLQTNKGIFEAGEDLWFKAYSLDAQNITASILDSTLYVQLSDRVTDSIVWQEKYQIANGFSDGHIFLDGSLNEGDYFLRAFTTNSLNSLTTLFQIIATRLFGSLIWLPIKTETPL